MIQARHEGLQSDRYIENSGSAYVRKGCWQVALQWFYMHDAAE